MKGQSCSTSFSPSSLPNTDGTVGDTGENQLFRSSSSFFFFSSVVFSLFSTSNGPAWLELVIKLSLDKSERLIPAIDSRLNVSRVDLFLPFLTLWRWEVRLV